MNDRRAAQILSLGRLSLGLVLAVAPRPALRAWTGDRDPGPAARLAARGLGGRDVAIAVGAMAALIRGAGDEAARWLEAGVMADASDALGTLTSRANLGTARWAALLALEIGAAATGVRLAGALRH